MSDPRTKPRARWRAFFPVLNRIKGVLGSFYDASGAAIMSWSDGLRQWYETYVYTGTASTDLPSFSTVHRGARFLWQGTASNKLLDVVLRAKRTAWGLDHAQPLFSEWGTLSNPVATTTAPSGASGVIYTIGTIPANLMAVANNGMLIAACVRKNGANATAIYTVRLASTIVARIDVDAADNSEAWFFAIVGVKGAASQTASGQAAMGFKAAALAVNSSVDMTADRTMDVAFNGNTNDAHELIGITVLAF